MISNGLLHVIGTKLHWGRWDSGLGIELEHRALVDGVFSVNALRRVCGKAFMPIISVSTEPSGRAMVGGALSMVRSLLPFLLNPLFSPFLETFPDPTDSTQVCIPQPFLRFIHVLIPPPLTSTFLRPQTTWHKPLKNFPWCCFRAGSCQSSLEC